MNIVVLQGTLSRTPDERSAITSPFINDERPHSSLENVPPAAVYKGTLTNSDKRQRGKAAGFSRSF